MSALTMRESQSVLVDWMDQEGDVLVEAMLHGVLLTVPELGAASEDPEAALKVALQSHVPGIRRALGDPSSQASLPFEAEAWARHLVHDGISLTATLRSFERGHADASHVIAATLKESRWGLTPERRADELEYASSRLLEYANTVTAQAISAYMDEQSKLERRDESSRLRAVTGLLQGDLEPRIAERSIAYRLDAVHTGYTLWDADGAARSDLEFIAAELVATLSPWQHLTVRDGDGAVNGWVSCKSNHPRSSFPGLAPPAGVRVAFGLPRRGLSGFRLTHREALEARRLRDAIHGEPVTTFEDVAVLVLASRDTELAQAFVEAQLGALSSDEARYATLRETLRVYLQERGSPAATAARLRLHRNTVVKRIEKIQETLATPIDRGSLNLRVALELSRISTR